LSIQAALSIDSSGHDPPAYVSIDSVAGIYPRTTAGWEQVDPWMVILSFQAHNT
jgi:hypothetical protein